MWASRDLIPSAPDKLENGLKILGIESNKDRIDRLRRFVAELELWNPKYGLLAGTEDVISRHVLDSLAALKYIEEFEPKNLADIGSGAGFPGIPLAIWLEDVNFTLIERSGRRAGFLRAASLILGLKNISIVEMPVERLSRKRCFDVLTLRGFSAIDCRLLNVLRGLLGSNGRIVAYKGREESVKKELASLEGCIAWSEFRRLEIPGLDEERHLLIIQPSSLAGREI